MVIDRWFKFPQRTNSPCADDWGCRSCRHCRSSMPFFIASYIGQRRRGRRQHVPLPVAGNENSPPMQLCLVPSSAGNARDLGHPRHLVDLRLFLRF
ncbi:hypothetical protein MRB53_035162 [Persea americana]|uniref:Uncharacterized protein n=1 Tax=Persea americana TaxID=3435 RepID=A0ACC2K3W4_PERAE|nr:hypothetical protein MRB53_035162 [Persea americana]